jgi:hypothetical protein
MIVLCDAAWIGTLGRRRRATFSIVLWGLWIGHGFILSQKPVKLPQMNDLT